MNIFYDYYWDDILNIYAKNILKYAHTHRQHT